MFDLYELELALSFCDDPMACEGLRRQIEELLLRESV